MGGGGAEKEKGAEDLRLALLTAVSTRRGSNS